MFALLAGVESARCRLRPEAGAAAHFRALESLYRARADQRACSIRRSRSPSRASPGSASRSSEPAYHAAGAAHGTLYFKMMDDAAFYACNSLVSDRFLLTTAFNLVFTRPLRAGPVIAEGRWVSGRRRVFVGEARLIDCPTARRRRAAPAPSCARTSRCRSLAGYRPADDAAARQLGAGRRRCCAAPRRKAGSARCSPKAIRPPARSRSFSPKGAKSSAFWSGCCSPTATIAWQECGAERRRTRRNSERSSSGGGDSIRICGSWNWISRPPNGSPLK